MKKFSILVVSAMLAACSAGGGVNVNDIASQMPKTGKVVISNIPSASNAVSNGLIVAALKTSGSNATADLIPMLATDDLILGISGDSQSVNKATMLYVLERVTTVGKNVKIYMLGDSQSDKAELEQAAKAKNVELHYVLKK